MKVCFRRWYVIGPVLLIALGVGLGASKQIEPTYTATGSYTFVFKSSEPVTPDQPDPRTANPLGGADSALLGEAVQADLTSTATQERLGRGNTGTAPGQPTEGNRFAVTLPQRSMTYIVQTWAPNRADAEGVVRDVLQAAGTQATAVQVRAGAPESSRYEAFVTSPAQVSTVPPQSQVKLLVAVLGAGLLAGAALSLLADRLLTRRAERHATPAPAAVPPEAARPAPVAATGPSEDDTQVGGASKQVLTRLPGAPPAGSDGTAASSNVLTGRGSTT